MDVFGCACVLRECVRAWDPVAECVCVCGESPRAAPIMSGPKVVHAARAHLRLSAALARSRIGMYGKHARGIAWHAGCNCVSQSRVLLLGRAVHQLPAYQYQYVGAHHRHSGESGAGVTAAARPLGTVLHNVSCCCIACMSSTPVSVHLPYSLQTLLTGFPCKNVSAPPQPQCTHGLTVSPTSREARHGPGLDHCRTR